MSSLALEGTALRDQMVSVARKVFMQLVHDPALEEHLEAAAGTKCIGVGI